MDLHRVRRTACDQEAGFTIIELVVAMTIFAVIMGALATGIIQIQRASHHVDVSTQNVDQARLAVAGVSRSLRAAVTSLDNRPAFEVAEADHAVFTAYLGSPEVPVRIELQRLANGDLRERVTTASVAGDGTVTYPPANRRERVLARGLETTGRLFTYTATDENGAEIVLGVAPGEELRRTVAKVRIDLAVSNDPSGRTGPQLLSTEVRLPNRVVVS